MRSCPSHPHRQRPQGHPAGLRDRCAALRRGGGRPGAEDLPGLPRHDRSARRAAGRVRVRPASVDVQRPRRGRRGRDTRRLRPGLAGHPTSCLECTPQCRSAAGLRREEVGPCVEQRGLSRFGDASPDLTYCAEALVAAFPDAQIVQVVRDGRDTVADMLKDQIAMSWFRPSMANVDVEFPNPFYGVEDETDRLTWPDLSPAGKCALRWRGRHQAGGAAAQEPCSRTSSRPSATRTWRRTPAARPPR